MRRALVTALLLSATLVPARAAFAGAGAYLVDDASITPAGHCQMQSWAQWAAGGQVLLNTLPACSTGPVEWSLGVEGQSGPFQHQESPAVKWMLRDPDQQAVGVAVNVDATWANGHVLDRNVYVATTWALDDARRWALNVELGAIDMPQSHWRTLTGLGLRYKMADQLSVIMEGISPWNGDAIEQLGLRWSYREHRSVDVIVGTSNANHHDRWITLGWNVGF